MYLTLRHEALIVALAAPYDRSRRAGGPVSNSQVVQLLVEREARRLKLPEPVLDEQLPAAEPGEVA